MIERAQRLCPRDPRGWFTSGAMAIAAIADENYSEAIHWAERALTHNQRFAVALRSSSSRLSSSVRRIKRAQSRGSC
jgi:hypothetical protein